jgi:hypothetical protein
MEFWGDSIIRHHCCVAFWIVSLSPADLSWLQNFSLSEAKWRWIDTSLKGHGHRESRDLYVKDMTAFDHFFWNTTADWCFRVVDDCYVNVAALDLFLAGLIYNGDPTKYSSVVGNCVISSGKWWLQGGAFGLSRHAVCRFLEMGITWFSDPALVEDLQFTKALEKMEFTSGQVDSPFFTGHLGSMNVLHNGTWNTSGKWEECPAVLPRERECSHRFVRYRHVVFHHIAHIEVSQRQWNEWIHQIPDNAVMFYREQNFVICRARDA